MFFKIVADTVDGWVDVSRFVTHFSVSQKINLKSSDFSVTLRNPCNVWGKVGSNWNVFQSEGLDVGSQVQIFISESPVDLSNDQPLFVGIISDVGSGNKSGKTLVLKGKDYNLRGLSHLWSQGFVNKTASEIVKELVLRAFDGAVDVSHVQNTSLTIDSYSVNYQPLYQVLQQLGSPQYTGSRNQFVFFLKGNGRSDPSLYWFDPSTNPSKTVKTLNASQVSIDGSRNTEGVVNHVIFYAGEDKNGLGITDHVFDPTIVSSGVKSVWENYGFISKNVKNALQLSGDYDSISNENFRAKCIDIGKTLAQNLINGLGNPRYDIKISGKKLLGLNVGDLISFSDPLTNLSKVVLRVQTVKTSFSTGQGFRADYELKQDQLAVSEVNA